MIFAPGTTRRPGRLWAAWAFCLFLATNAGQSAPAGNPAQPYWQNTIPGVPYGPGRRIGGTWREVTPHPPPTLKEFKAEIDRQRIQWELDRDQRQDTIGLWVKVAGLAVLVFAAAAHLSTSLDALRSVASSIATLGAGLYVVGLFIQIEAKYSKWIELAALGILLAALAYILWRYREWSISHLFKPKPKADP